MKLEKEDNLIIWISDGYSSKEQGHNRFMFWLKEKFITPESGTSD